MFWSGSSSRRAIAEEEEEEEEDAVVLTEELEEEEEEEHTGHGKTCGKGHRWSLVLETSEGGTICLACFSALLSDPSSPCHHVSYALSQLSAFINGGGGGAAAASSSNALQHAHLLVLPLVRALFCDNFSRDESLARQLTHLISNLSSYADADASAPSVSTDFISLIADRLSSPSAGISAWNPSLVYSLHCFGILLDSQCIGDPSLHIRDKMALFSNLVAALRLPSEEIGGEILFVLYKLSDTRATPWDDDDVCDDNDTNHASFAELKLLLIRLSLEALLKTQHDDVRMNCLALLTVFSQRGFFDNYFVNGQSGRSFDEASSMMLTDETELQTPLINLFADAVKGPLLSSDTQVQIRTLDVIFRSLSSHGNCDQQIQTFVEENIADYVFEILRLSGNKDLLVISCLQVLTVLATAQDTFRQRLAIGFPTLLSVLSYIAEIPFHLVQFQVLQLVRRCILDCPGVISMPQTEEIAVVLTKIFIRYTSGKVGLQSETLILACLTFVEILKLPSAAHIQKLSAMVEEASRNLILSSLSLPQGISNQILLYSLYLLKEAHFYSLSDANSENKLETSITETCEFYLLPWLERAVDEGEEEELVLDVLETFHVILLQGSEVETRKLAEVLASSSWFSLSFRCLGLFSSERMKSQVYLMLSSVLDRAVAYEFGQPIRDAYVHLPSDPLDLLFLLGQRSSYDCNLTCCQRAVLLILYCSSFYGESLAEDNQVLASLEQYVIVNGSNFTCGTADSTMLTQVVFLYSLIRAAPISHRTAYSPEAEKKLFCLITEQEWDILKMGAHPLSLKWLFQQEAIVDSLLNQMLSFCRLYSTYTTQINFHATAFQIMDIPMIAELVASGGNNMALVLVSLLRLAHEDSREDDVISVINVMAEILDICPGASNQFCLKGICDDLHSVYSSMHSSSVNFKICSFLVFKILSSANQKTIFVDGEWFSVTIKLIEFFNASLASKSFGEEGSLVISIFCLILHHSTNHVLKEASMAILLNKSLVSVVDSVVQGVCAEGSYLIDQEEVVTGNGLIFVLLLYYFSLKSLYANFQETLDWQDFLQSSDDKVLDSSVICIKCHDLCRLIHFGPSLVKLVASQCLVEVLNAISEQRNIKHDELRCSLSHLESIMAVIESLVFYGDYTVAMNCGMCLSMIVRWEKLGILEMQVIKNSKWLRLIMEELVMTLAVPSLASKCLTNQHKPAAHVAAALLRMGKIPGWIESVFDVSCISGIVESISAGNVSAEMVILLRELMTRKYLNKEHVVRLHHLFQVCRKQVYEGASKGPFTKPSLESMVGVPGSTNKLCSMLLNLMLYPLIDNNEIQTEQNRLLEEIDMFFLETSTLS